MVKALAVILLAMVVVAYSAEADQPRGVVAGVPDKKTDLDTASSFIGGYGLGFGYGGLYGGWGGWGWPGYAYRGYGWGWPGYGYGGFGGFYG